MPAAALRRKIEAGELQPDDAQMAVAEELDRLARELQGYSLARERPGGFLGLFGGRSRKTTPEHAAPRGVYVHGGVGRGKSMLMDLFFEVVEVERKRRTHFHAFMLDIHARLHRLRRGGGKEEPLGRIAEELASEHHLLCFDEFHVVNIADAMILRRLFEPLFELGVVVVATSNWPPDRLYENGLNRDRFLPFIGLLEERNVVLALDGPTDYRLGRLESLEVYHHPLGEAATTELEEVFASLTDGASGAPDEIMVGSRRLVVPRAHGAVAWLTFVDFCEQALGAADYLALSEQYSALLLDGVPELTPDRRNEARRFMILVDACYERKTMLFIAADAPPEKLYTAGDGAFEFQRTVSRLMEMRSTDYLEQCRARPIGVEHAPFEPYALTSDLI